MLILERSDCGRFPTLPVAEKFSWRHQMIDLLTLSRLKTSRLEISSLTHPRARPRSTILSLPSWRLAY